MNFCINDFLLSISMAIDFAEKDVLKVVTNHNKRVALVCGKIGRDLGMPDEDIFDLVSYALLHDNGVLQYKSEFYDKNAEESKVHTVVSQRNIAGFPFLNPVDNVLLYHHENYDGSGYFGKCKDEIPVYSQIIALSDDFERLYRAHENRDDIVSSIKQRSGFDFAPNLVDAWVCVQDKTNFWLDIDDMFVDIAISNELPKFYIDLTYAQLREVTKVFSSIIDSKSPFTANHSSGISEKARILAKYYGFDYEKVAKLVIAADLHDIGKLFISNSILDKNGRLTAEEFALIKQHTYFTRRALEKINKFEDITEWASNHHEKLNGKGYPYGFDASQLDFCSRLIAVLDIYQALIEDRPYRVGISHQSAIKILKNMSDAGEIDSKIVNDVDTVFNI